MAQLKWSGSPPGKLNSNHTKYEKIVIMDSEIIPRFKSIKENKALTNNYGLLFTNKTLLGPFLVFVVTLYSPLAFSQADHEKPRFVSSSGSDIGKCDNALKPCRTILYAGSQSIIEDFNESAWYRRRPTQQQCSLTLKLVKDAPIKPTMWSVFAVGPYGIT